MKIDKLHFRNNFIGVLQLYFIIIFFCYLINLKLCFRYYILLFLFSLNMCILFSYISKRIKPGEFKLIILNNRDEYHHRASQAAKFVTDNNIYGKKLKK
jgi:hypothetical protein